MATKDALSKREIYFVLDLISKSLAIQDSEGLSSLIQELQGEIEFSYSALAYVHGDENSNIKSFEGINVCFPAEFAEHYIIRNIPKQDPTVKHHMQSFGLSHWSDFAATGEMSELYGDFMIREAYLHGLRQKNTNSGSFFTISGQNVPRSERTDSILEIIMPHLHEAITRVLGNSHAPLRTLSDREMEVLKWIAEGKSTWDIAMILRLSERTVNFHASNIIKKLDASNRAHAVAVAYDRNILGLL